MGFFLMLLLIALIFALFPAWPYSRRWGYRPSGALGVVLVLWLILLCFAVIPWWGWGWGSTGY